MIHDKCVFCNEEEFVKHLISIAKFFPVWILDNLTKRCGFSFSMSQSGHSSCI